MHKILLSETILIERQYFVEKVSSTNEVSISTEINSLTSSKAINAGRIMSKHSDVYMLGCVGKDADGDRAIEDLKRYGIHPQLVTRTSKAKTGQVVVMTDRSGDSAITLYLGANSFAGESLKKHIVGIDYIYAASSMKLDRLYELILLAHEKKVGVFLDFPGQLKELNKEKLRTVDFIVPNRQEAGVLVGHKLNSVEDAMDAARKLKKFTDGNVVISLDKDGCVIVDANDNVPKHLKTSKVKVVDTTASGDIFRGVLLVEYLKNKNLESAALKALDIATESVKIKGVDSSIKRCQERYS